MRFEEQELSVPRSDVHSARWFGPFLLGIGLLFVGLSIYLRATAQVPPVASRPIPIAPQAFENAQRDGEPDARWRTDVELAMARLAPLSPPLPPAQPGDWQTAHPEPGQTFAQYLQAHPNRPTAARHTLYVQPIGLFSEGQRRIVRLAAEYLGRYFRLPVQILPDLPTKAIPVSAVRRHPGTHELQIHSGTILRDILAPRLPADAAAYIGFTAIDLFPDKRWNYVFGEASPSLRTGIWSLARFGNPATSEASFRLALLRTLKTASHETGHMFGARHCTAHACNMNGANSLEEADRTPIDLCPECLAKICWLTGTTPAEWLRTLLEFYQNNNFVDESARTRRYLQALIAPAHV